MGVEERWPLVKVRLYNRRHRILEVDGRVSQESYISHTPPREKRSLVTSFHLPGTRWILTSEVMNAVTMVINRFQS